MQKYLKQLRVRSGHVGEDLRRKESPQNKVSHRTATLEITMMTPISPKVCRTVIPAVFCWKMNEAKRSKQEGQPGAKGGNENIDSMGIAYKWIKPSGRTARLDTHQRR